MKDVFITRVRSALAILGYDETAYASHSFRIGAATMGLWESSAYQLYVRASHQMLASMSRRLVSRPMPELSKVVIYRNLFVLSDSPLCFHYHLSHQIRSCLGFVGVLGGNGFAFQWMGLGAQFGSLQARQ